MQMCFLDNCIFVPVDVTKPEDVEAALQRTKDKFGRLDAAVNCAGIGVAFKTYNFNKKKAHLLDDFIKVRVLVLLCHTKYVWNAIQMLRR